MTDAEPPTLHSRRTLSLRFNIPISKTSRFWESLGEGRFVTTKCRSCGEVVFPPQADCPRCTSGDVDWVDLGTEAELVTFTHVQVTPTSFVDHDPYTVGIGQLPQGVRVLAWIEGAPIERLSPGVKLRLEARKTPEGSPYYVFVPAG